MNALNTLSQTSRADSADYWMYVSGITSNTLLYSLCQLRRLGGRVGSSGDRNHFQDGSALGESFVSSGGIKGGIIKYGEASRECGEAS